ncbi:glycosyltransferase [Burkholderia sp. Ax-1719]|uniref:glycosyltransferase family 2 protein n=1 Tax=Burkholderia sp. Ax-1719 TaxID=2608334 RepID=UPI00142495C9|nr:glycosyltransferase [Burkholderia sp. Ax-1719]NIE65524.1 glycosyltransferase family 2 protein [Burkholderia sp. Ax-1719]
MIQEYGHAGHADRTDLPANDASRPLVSMLLIAFNQASVIADAVAGALAQTYSPLEILISDDCSSDDTWAVIEAAVRGYSGPHRVVLNRNEQNAGISAHLSQLAAMSRGALLVVTAGDDVSAPERCARLVECWNAHGRSIDLIASDLEEFEGVAGQAARIAPTGLDQYKGFDDWKRGQPWVVGASHAWSRRLFERFGPMLPGAMAEDQIMTFRAVMSGGAHSLREPLVRYRRGGLSGKKRYRTVEQFVERVKRTTAFGLAESEQFQRDAQIAGVGDEMRTLLVPKLARERYARDVFALRGIGAKLQLLLRTPNVKFGFKIRMFLYAACPTVYRPFFALRARLKR